MKFWKYVGEFLAFRWLLGLLEHEPERIGKASGSVRPTAEDDVTDRWDDSHVYGTGSELYDDSSDYFHEEQDDFDSFDF